MKKFLATQFFKFSKMKVVHSLPGRVRFSVPGLKMVDPSFLHFEEDLVAILLELKGVNQITLCSITGKALVLYDHAVIHEKDLLAKFKQTWDTLIDELMQLDSNTEVTNELVKSYRPRLLKIVESVNEGI